MNKKTILAVLLIVLLAIQIFIRYGQAQTGNEAEKYAQQAQEVESKIERARERWEYLGEEWQKILLKNRFINFLDSIGKKLSPLASILLGQQYSLTLSFFLVALLWLIMAVETSRIFTYGLSLPKWAGIPIGFAFSTLLAQLNLYAGLVSLVASLILIYELWWARLVITIILLAVLFVFFYLLKYLGDYARAKQEERKKEQAELARDVIIKTARGLEKGMGQI